jgi:hypothetical protein
MVDPITGSLLIGAGSNLLGGVLGSRSAKKGAKTQAAAAAEVKALYDQLKIPTIADQSVQLEEGQVLADYNPELEQLLNLQPSEYENIETSPEYKELQLQTLRKMAGVGEDGLDEGDEAAFREAQRAVANEAQAQQASILNNMAQRGTLGGGMELAARLQGAQDSANRLSSAGDKLTQDARARALQALTQTGSMAGNLRSQDFEEQEKVARAKDAINEFNVRNQQQLQGRNISEQNRALLANMQARQAMADSNRMLRNQEQQYNKQLQQQDFENQMRKIQGRSGAATGVGNAQANIQNANAQMFAGIGSALGGAATAYGAAAQQKANAQANRESAERMALLGGSNRNTEYNRRLQNFDPNEA